MKVKASIKEMGLKVGFRNLARLTDGGKEGSEERRGGKGKGSGRKGKRETR